VSHRFVLIILAAAIASIGVHRVEADSVTIAGRSMSCGSTPVFSDSSLQMEGRFVPGEGIYLNQQLMQRQPAAVQFFVFKHECAHKVVGGNELAADCNAARSGAREKWLTPAGVDTVCQALGGEPASGRYPSGVARCANIRKCYSGSSPTIAYQKSKSQKSAGSGRLRSAY
jgi:hypothetical protein